MLIDDLLSPTYSHSGLARRFPGVFEGLRRASVYDVDAVAAYLERHEDERARGPFNATKALPNVAPLGPVSWFEWRPKGVDTARQLGAVGVLEAIVSDAAADGEALNWSDGQARPEQRWGLMLFFFWSDPAGDSTLAYASLQLGVDAQGSLCGAAFYDLHRECQIEDEATAWPLWAPAYVVLSAVCFAHCKGVTIRDHDQPRQQRRAAERAGRPPLVTYKTIDIAPVTRILRDEGHSEQAGISKALHVCRGHFAHYTDERPLFGKYTGTFFRPMHVRGTLEAGVALKDYRVLSSDPAESV